MFNLLGAKVTVWCPCHGLPWAVWIVLICWCLLSRWEEGSANSQSITEVMVMLESATKAAEKRGQQIEGEIWLYLSFCSVIGVHVSSHFHLKVGKQFYTLYSLQSNCDLVNVLFLPWQHSQIPSKWNCHLQFQNDRFSCKIGSWFPQLHIYFPCPGWTTQLLRSLFFIHGL